MNTLPIHLVVIVLLAAPLVAVPGCGDPKGSPNSGTAGEGIASISIAPLPRPAPPSAIDHISAKIIGRKAGDLSTDAGPTAWMDYGDACLMNLWPAEAVLAYGRAIGLPGADIPAIQWRLFRAHQDLGDHEDAESAAVATLELAPDFEAGWIGLANLRLENGDLEGAEEALGNVPPANRSTVRYAVVSIPLDLQAGRTAEARAAVDALLLEQPNRTTRRLGVMVGQAMNDRELVDRLLPGASEGLIRIEDPWIAKLSPLARHERADLLRAIRIKETLPPEEALPRVRRLVSERPKLPMLRVVAAGILEDMGRLKQAKAALDSVHEGNPPDHEYWAQDALIHLKLAQAGRDEWMDRARRSSDRAIQINPTIAYGWQIRALVHEHDARWIDAAEAFTLAAEHAETPLDQARWLEEASRCRNREPRP
ncbi:MAG: tetratricopeptide repeat protein [Phycisphaera sp.]|nr:tetratricopeptide repeat protein [Phycisphaera sp.]